MPTPLLATKLFVPQPRRGSVARPRLNMRLDRGLTSKLTLVSAPAGFGKTTLVAEWLAARSGAEGTEGPAAWLSLDSDDNDPASFWTYVITALRTAAPTVGTTALERLREPRLPPTRSLLTMLLNDLDEMASELVLALDDYHVIEAREVQDGMAFLLDHLPPRLHVVIVSRSDPVLPLANLRARGELAETRATDLRFTPEEAAAYLNEVMHLQLTAMEVAALESRTEGWIAALQLAALSMQGRDDIAGFLAGFAGDDRYVVDYLVEEVLGRQSDDVQAFLLQTSVLGRLSGPLCDAVTDQHGGKAMLEALDRANMFLVPLDDRRQWYRYHHLFADVLEARLRDEQPDTMPQLHRRASAWFEGNGDQPVAIAHALDAKDFARAAELVERAIPEMRRNRHAAKLRGWLEALPDELIRLSPGLSVSYAGALLSTGELDGVEPRLRDAERLLEGSASQDAREDSEERRRLPGSICVYRAAQAQAVGDVVATVAHAHRALELLAPDDHLERGAAAGFLGLAAWAGGDLEAGYRSYAECRTSLQRAGHLFDVLGCAIILADIRTAQGRLRDAGRAYDQGLRLAAEQGGSILQEATDMYVGIGELHCERGDLDAAAEHLLGSQQRSAQAGLGQDRYRWRIAMARVRRARGDLDGALALLDEAGPLSVTQFSPDVQPIGALKAGIWIAQGRMDDALAWKQERELSADDALTYVREFEHITLARLLLARCSSHSDPSVPEAIRLLERLLRAAEEGGRTGSVISILVLLALAHQMIGDVPAALMPLARALALAEPEGYVQTFVQEGEPMAALLAVAARHAIVPSHVARLLAACDETQTSEPRAAHGLVDSLSERERDVLRLLATDLSGPQIALELIVSLSTVRTHTNRIYTKLGVNNRRAAIRRAKDLDLLSRNR